MTNMFLLANALAYCGARQIRVWCLDQCGHVLFACRCWHSHLRKTEERTRGPGHNLIKTLSILYLRSREI